MKLLLELLIVLMVLPSWAGGKLTSCDLALNGVLNAQKQALTRFYGLEKILTNGKKAASLEKVLNSLAEVRLEIQSQFDHKQGVISEETYQSLVIIGEKGRKQMAIAKGETEKMAAFREYFLELKPVIYEDPALRNSLQVSHVLPTNLLQEKDTIAALATALLSSEEGRARKSSGFLNFDDLELSLQSVEVNEISESSDLAAYAQYVFLTQQLKVLSRQLLEEE